MLHAPAGRIVGQGAGRPQSPSCLRPAASLGAGPGVRQKPLTHGPTKSLPPTADARLSVAATRELWGWAAVATGSLAVAGLFALFLAVSRIPGVEDVFPWPIDFFRKGLVIHVVFSFVVWFLAVFGALSVLAAEALHPPAPARLLGPPALLGMILGAPLLFLPALLDRGEATLNDYVPAIINPLYYAGLALMGVAIALVAIRVLVAFAGRRGAPPGWAMTIAGGAFVYLLAATCFVAAAYLLEGRQIDYVYNQELFWGGGHLLQFLNTLLIVAAWSLLAESVAGRPLAGPRLLLAATLLIVLPAMLAPFFYVVLPPLSAAQAEAFTNLQYALGLPPLLVATAIATRLPRPIPWRDPGFLCLALSAVVFFVGGSLGLFVDGGDTRTPAHYHGVIAGVTLAFFGLFHVLLLPALGRSLRRGKLLYSQIYCFAGGQLAACIGLFLAGGFGAPRKTAGTAQGLEGAGAVVGMAMNGIGGLVAVIGGVLFIWTVAAALLRRPAPSQRQLAGSSQLP
jgi:heme/copper-type cytochrome/quinol oxidase subunit 1